MPITFGPITVERWKAEQTHAGVYLLKQRLILHGECLTNIGGLACEPYLAISAEVSNEDLGTRILWVLAEARKSTIPTDMKAEREKILSAAGVRSWSKLCEGLQCSISQIPPEIRMLPTRRDGKSFLHLPDLEVRLPDSSGPEAVGNALRDALKRCS
jgi:hypothetical protein